MEPTSTRRWFRDRRRSAGPRGERGMVTAEIAMALPAVGAVIVLVIWAVSAVIADLRCDDAAREAARAIARGEPRDVVAEIVRGIGPADSRLNIGHENGLVVVEVETRVALPGPFTSPAIEVSGRAVALEEGM